MEYFNTQPYLASFILGAASGWRRKGHRGATRHGDVSALKNTLDGASGSAGRQFFLGSAQAACSMLIAVAMLMTGVTGGRRCCFWFFIIAFMSGSGPTCCSAGIDSTGDVVSLMSRYPFTRMAQSVQSRYARCAGRHARHDSDLEAGIQDRHSASRHVTAAAALLITLASGRSLKKGGSPRKTHARAGRCLRRPCISQELS